MVDELLCYEILDRCKQIGDKIVFSGAEPFLYRNILSLLKYTVGKNIFLQIDTNGLLLNSILISKLKNIINLISVSIDLVREKYSKIDNNFNRILSVLKYINYFGIPLKINTIVTKININHLNKLFNILKNFDITLWSFYQFCGNAYMKDDIKKNFYVSDKNFICSINEIESCCNFPIEINLANDRCNFLVTNIGNVYNEKLKKVGSIFDKDIFEKWEQSSNFSIMRIREKQRYGARKRI